MLNITVCQSSLYINYGNEVRKRPLGVNPGYIHNRDLASFQVPGPDVYLSHNILFFLKGNLGVEAGNSSTPSYLAGGKISAVRYLLYLPK